MKNLFFVVVVSLLMLMGSGCATILSKSNWPVTINSNPDDAKVTIIDQKGNGVHSGTTPMTITLKSGAGYFKSARYQVMFEKDGYLPSSQNISGEMNPWYLANLFFGDMFIVDPLTGAMWKLPERVNQTLPPDPRAPSEQKYSPSSISPQPEKTRDDAFTKLKKLKELKDEGILTDEEYELKRKVLLEGLNPITQSATF